MPDLNNVSLWVKNFKCFGSHGGGFEKIKPFNLIIGRNNSGKSSLLDLLEHVVASSFDKIDGSLYHNNVKPQFQISTLLKEQELQRIFRPGTSGGDLGGRHWEDFGAHFVGQKISYSLTGQKGGNLIAYDVPVPLEQKRIPKERITSRIDGVCNHIENCFSKVVLKRIYAERDIEAEIDGDISVSGNGMGVTNIIQKFLNMSNLPSDEVEVNILNDLNKIFGPDGNFKRILCQKIENNKWEIFLDEDIKGRVALSNSGSGLKTIITVIVFLRLIPIIESCNLRDYIFCFEELENNLHPSLLRRFLSYIYNLCIDNEFYVFLTTHSNISIDSYSKNDQAQIIHVTQKDGLSSVRTVQTYIDNRGILDDLDVRASDLLQSNCIIWVEGPSDRIYVNRWMELWTNGTLKEGTHYQCVFYGGRLLSHLDATVPGDGDNGVSIIQVNKNAILLIDSDKRSQQGRLNDTKKRLISEIEDIGGFAWVTKGKEIENYISSEAVSGLIGKVVSEEVGQYSDFFDYLDLFKINEGKKYRQKKSLLAERLVPYLSKKSLQKTLDLDEQMKSVILKIKEWNCV